MHIPFIYYDILENLNAYRDMSETEKERAADLGMDKISYIKIE